VGARQRKLHRYIENSVPACGERLASESALARSLGASCVTLRMAGDRRQRRHHGPEVHRFLRADAPIEGKRLPEQGMAKFANDEAAMVGTACQPGRSRWSAIGCIMVPSVVLFYLLTQRSFVPGLKAGWEK
jgi:hypothetical protein